MQYSIYVEDIVGFVNEGEYIFFKGSFVILQDLVDENRSKGIQCYEGVVDGLFFFYDVGVEDQQIGDGL